MTDSTDDEHSYLYVGDVNEHLICPICRQPFLEPAQTHCGHTFCHSCIVQALQSSSLCPIDRQPLSLEDVKPAPKIVASLVNELVVSCPRQCGANVERACLRGHLNGTCDLEPIICACGETIIRRDQKSVLDFEQQEASDLSGCLHEWQFCDDCSTRVQRLDRKSHLLSCPSQQSSCQYCSMCIPNSLLQSHNALCPAYPISCPHVPLGCPSTVLPRERLATHLETCAFAPLAPLLNSLLTRLCNLETAPPPPPDPEIDRLRADLNILNQALGDLEIRFSNAVVSERIRMGEDVERLRGQVGALRREVWFSRRGMEPGSAATAGTASGPRLSTPGELVPARRLSGLCPFPNQTVRKLIAEMTTKQVKL